MLSRASLSLLRPRALPPTSRLLLSQSQIRGYRRSDSTQPQDIVRDAFQKRTKSSQSDRPLRPVPAPPQSLHSSTRAFAQSQPNPSSKSTLETQDTPSTSSQDAHTGTQASSQPLPDLTQGIPSTIDAELSRAQRKTHAARESLNITEDPEEPQPGGVGDRDGDGLPRSSYVSSSDQRRSVLIRYFYLSFIVGGLAYAVYMGRDWNEEEKDNHPDIPNGYTPSLIYQRASARFGSTVSYYKDPVTKKLLPDVPPGDLNMPLFTLVMGLEDVLIRSEWSREHGWRIAKRPGLDYFLKYMSLYYELVIFSTQPSYTVDQIHRKLDPYQMIYPLFREMTLYEDGGYIKDLSYLNRDLNKVVMLDSDPHHAKNQPENAIIIPKWDGNTDDTTLIDFIPFFEYLATMGFQDSREVLKSFEGKYIPVEFDRRQKLIREKFEAERAQKKSKRSFGGVGSLFGKKTQSPDGIQSLNEAEAQGKMIWDQIRERGHDMYTRLDEHLTKEGPKMIAEREAMEKKMQEEAMANMKTGMFGWFGPGANPGEKK